MSELTTRLRRRMDFLGLSVEETAARTGVEYKTFSRYITGTAKQNLHPETFSRLCRVLAIKPDQAFGLSPTIGIDAQIPTGAGTRDIERIRAGLSILDAADLRLAVALLETVGSVERHE